jgi:hypothetical protein
MHTPISSSNHWHNLSTSTRTSPTLADDIHIFVGHVVTRMPFCSNYNEPVHTHYCYGVENPVSKVIEKILIYPFYPGSSEQTPNRNEIEFNFDGNIQKVEIIRQVLHKFRAVAICINGIDSHQFSSHQYQAITFLIGFIGMNK